MIYTIYGATKLIEGRRTVLSSTCSLCSTKVQRKFEYIYTKLQLATCNTLFLLQSSSQPRNCSTRAFLSITVSVNFLQCFAFSSYCLSSWSCKSVSIPKRSPGAPSNARTFRVSVGTFSNAALHSSLKELPAASRLFARAFIAVETTPGVTWVTRKQWIKIQITSTVGLYFYRFIFLDPVLP